MWIWHWFGGGLGSRFDPVPGFHGNLYSAGFGNFGLQVQGKASLLFTPSRKVWSETRNYSRLGLVLRSSSGLVLCKKKDVGRMRYRGCSLFSALGLSYFLIG